MPTQRPILFALGVILLLGVAGLAWNLTDTPPAPIQAPAPTITPKKASAAPTQLDPTQGAPSAITSVATPTQLSVLVFDENGKRLPECRIHLVSPDGEEYQQIGQADLRDCTPGEWSLTVRQKGKINHRQPVSVAASESQRVLVRMGRVIRITGSATNLFGKPPGPMAIWFLAEGETHPDQRHGVMKIAGGMIDNMGKFTVDVPKPGAYRVSIGPVGEVIMASPQAYDLHGGSPSHLSVVIPGSCDVSLELDSVPPGVADGSVRLDVALLARSSDINEGRKIRKRPGILSRPSVASGEKHLRNRKERDPEKDRAARKEPSTLRPDKLKGGGASQKKQNRKTELDPTPPLDVSVMSPDAVADPQDPQRSGEQWQEFRNATLTRQGTCQFGFVPTHFELRVALVRGNDRHESGQPFRLLPDTQTILSVQAPSKRNAKLIEKRPVGLLTVFVQARPADRSSRKPGFTWE